MDALSLRLVAAGGVVLGLVASGCAAVLGLSDYESGEGGAAPTGASTGSQQQISTVSGQTTSATTQTGSSDASSSSGMMFCVPMSEIGCYEGPPGTEGIGACQPGKKTCLPDGSAYGECEGDTQPVAMDDCTAMTDANCDNILACTCVPDSTMSCYDGTPGTVNVGLCKRGTRTCRPDGTAYGACEGQTVDLPVDNCATPEDDDCDGTSNDGCVCFPNATEGCYSGPGGTQNVGACHGGMHTCNAQGTAWGPCVGETLPMPEACDVVGDEDCNGAGCGDAVWSRLLQTNQTEDYPLTESIAFDSTGGVVVAGYLVQGAAGTIDVGGTTIANAYMARYDDTGALSWSKTPDPGIDGFLVAAGNQIYVLAGYSGTVNVGGTLFTSAGQGDLLVIAYNTAGTQQWVRSFGGTGSESPTDIAFRNGSLVIAGSFNGSVTFPGLSAITALNRDSFVVELNPANGNPLWVRHFGDVSGQPANDQYVLGVALDAGGGVYAGGYFSGTLRLANVNYTASGFSDAFLTKIDTNGTTLWGRVYGGVSSDRIEQVAVDSAGASLITGYIGGSVDFGGGGIPFGGGTLDAYVAKIDTNGTHVWSKDVGGPGGELGYDIDVDGSDNVVLAGSFGTSVTVSGHTIAGADGSSLYFVKLDSAGNYLWSRAPGDTFGQAYPYIAAGPMGRVGIAFLNQGTVDLGNGNLTSLGNQDSLVIGVLNP